MKITAQQISRQLAKRQNARKQVDDVDATAISRRIATMLATRTALPNRATPEKRLAHLQANLTARRGSAKLDR
jgi:hypothetical protein